MVGDKNGSLWNFPKKMSIWTLIRNPNWFGLLVWAGLKCGFEVAEIWGNEFNGDVDALIFWKSNEIREAKCTTTETND